jgi:predicted ATP-grasp superfamily ATP-dependent carboligase
VTDVPACNQNIITIPAGHPVCTVLACAGNADAAKKLAHSRVETMQSLLQSLNRTSGADDYNFFSAQGH